MDFTQVIGGSPSFLDTSTYERYQAATLVVGEENYQIYNKETLIGRDELCDIVIRNQAVSCRHAVIEVEDKDSHVIYDLGSTNKTRLGKMVLKPHIRYHLRDGETLIFGNITTTYNYFEETDGQKEQGGRSTPTLIPESPERCDMMVGVIAETPCKEGSFIEGTLHETSTDLFQDSNTPIGSPSIYDIQTETMVELDLKSLPNNSGDDIYEIATQEKSFETNENSQNVNVEKKCNTNFEDSLRADETLTDYNISKQNSVCNISLSHESTSSSNQTGDPNVSFGPNKEDIGVNVKKLFTLPILNKPESNQNIIYTEIEGQGSKDNFKSSESLTANRTCGGIDASFSEMLTQPPSVAILFARADSPNTCEPVIGQTNVVTNNLKSHSDSSDRNAITQKGNSHKSDRNESSMLHDTSISDLPTQSSLLPSKSTLRRELFKVPEEVKRIGISVDNRIGKTYCNSKAILLNETEGVALSEMLTQPRGQLSIKPTCKDPEAIYNENPAEEGALHNLSISDMLTQPAVLSAFDSTGKNPKLINNEKSAEEVALYNTSISDMLTQSNGKSSIKVAYKDLDNEQSVEELDLQNITISDMFSQISGRPSIEPTCENPKMIFLKETTEEPDNNMSISDMLTQPNFENRTNKISRKKPLLESSKMDSKGTINDNTKVYHFEECGGIMDPNNMSMSDMLTQPTNLGFEPLFGEVTKPHHQYVLDNGSGTGCSPKGPSDDPELGNIEKRSEILDFNNMSMSDMLTQPNFEPLMREVTKPHRSEHDKDSVSGGSCSAKDTFDDPELGNIEKRSEITDLNNMSMSDMLTQPNFKPLTWEVTKPHRSELDKDSGSGGSCSAKDTFDDPELGNIEKRSEITDLNNMSMSDMLTQPILFKPPIKEIAPEDSLKCSRTKKNIRENMEINVSNEMDMPFIPSKLNIVCQPAVEKMKNYEELNIQPSIKSDNQSQKFLTSGVKLSSLIHKGCRGNNEAPNHENLFKTVHQIKSHKPKNCTTISNKVIGEDLGFSEILTQPSGSTLIESGITLESHYEVEDISEMLTQPSRTTSSDISKSHTDVQSSERKVDIDELQPLINMPLIPTIVSLNSSNKFYEQETQLPENNDEEMLESKTKNQLTTSYRNKKLVSDKSEQDQTVDEVRTNESNLKNIAENSSLVSNADIVEKDEATNDPSDEEENTPVVVLPKRKASKKLPSDEEESQENSEVFIKKPKKPMKILLSDDECNQTVEENEVNRSIKSVEHLKKTFSSTIGGKSKFSSSMKNVEESLITNVGKLNNPDKQSGKFSNIQKSLPLANCVVKLARLEVISNDKVSATSGRCENELEKKLSSSSSDNVNLSNDSGNKRKSTPLKSKCKSVLLSLSKALVNLKNTEVDETNDLSKEILSTVESICEEKEGNSKSLCSNKDLSRIDTHEICETGASLDNKIGPIAFDRILMKQEKPICTSTPLRKSFKNFKKTSINSSDLHNTTITLTRGTSGKIKDVQVEGNINEVTSSPSKRSSKTVFLKSNSNITVTKVEINDSDKRSTRSKKSVDQIDEENNIFIENDGRFQKKDTFPTQLEREDKDSEQKFISPTIHSDSKQNIKRSNFNISDGGILNKALGKQNIQSENLDSKEELGRGRRKCTKKQFEGFETDVDIASRGNKQTRGRKDSDPKFQQVLTRKLRSKGGQEHVQAENTNKQTVSLIDNNEDRIITTSEARLLKKGKTCLLQSNKQSSTEEKHLEDIKEKNLNFTSDTKRIKLSSDPLLSDEQTERSKGSISSIDENTSKTETGSSKKRKVGSPSKSKQSLIEETDSGVEEKEKLSSASLLSVEETGRRGRGKVNISSIDKNTSKIETGPAKKGKLGTPSKNKQSLVEATDSGGEEEEKLSSASLLSVEETGRRGRSKVNISSIDKNTSKIETGPAKKGKLGTPSKNKQSLVEATDSGGEEKEKLSSGSLLSVEETGRRGRSKGSISSIDKNTSKIETGPAKKGKLGTPSKNKQSPVEATDSDGEEKGKLSSASLLSVEETGRRGRGKVNISSIDKNTSKIETGPAKKGKLGTPSKNKQSLVEATDSDGEEKGKLSSASLLSVEETGRRGRSKGSISSTDKISPKSEAGPAKKGKVGTPPKNKHSLVEVTDSDDEEEKRKLSSASLLSTEETRKRRKLSTGNTKDNIVEVSKAGIGKLEVLYTNPSEEEKDSENKDFNLKPPSLSPKTLKNVEIKEGSPRKGKSFRKGLRKVKADKKEPPPSPQENINSVPNLLNRVSSITPLPGPSVSTNKNTKFEKIHRNRGRKCKIEADQFEEVSNPSIKFEQESFSSGISSNLSIEYSIKHTSLRSSSSPQKSSFSLTESCNEDQGDHPSKKQKTEASDMPRKRSRPCIQASLDSAEKSFTEESSINRKRRKTNSKVGKENENTSLTLMSPRSLRSESEISTHEKVMFTGYSDSKMMTLIKRLGGEVVESHLTCTVLVTDKVRRTVKFLCALGKGCPIVSPDWLLACRAVGKFTDPFLHLLLDEEAENKFSFNLRSSIEKSISSKLLTGFSIFVTPTVKPPPIEMKSIIESCGGVHIAKIPASWPNQSVVISCVEDKSRWRTLKKHGTTPPIVSAEALLSGILQHKFSVNLYKI